MFIDIYLENIFAVKILFISIADTHANAVLNQALDQALCRHEEEAGESNIEITEFAVIVE